MLSQVAAIWDDSKRGRTQNYTQWATRSYDNCLPSNGPTRLTSLQRKLPADAPICEPKNLHRVAIGHKDQDHKRNEEGKKGNKERMKNKGKNKKKSPGRMHF